MEMLTQTLSDMLKEIMNTPFDWSAFGIMSMIFMFLFLFYQAQKREHLDWTDLITANGSTAVSLTKCLQLIGGVVGTWIMIKTTLQGKLTWDLFAIYLAYVASVDGFSKFIAAKYGIKIDDKSPPSPPV